MKYQEELYLERTKYIQQPHFKLQCPLYEYCLLQCFQYPKWLTLQLLDEEIREAKENAWEYFFQLDFIHVRLNQKLRWLDTKLLQTET